MMIRHVRGNKLMLVDRSVRQLRSATESAGCDMMRAWGELLVVDRSWTHKGPVVELHHANGMHVQ